MSTDASGQVFYGFALIDREAIEPWENETEDDEEEVESPYTDWENRYIKAKGGLGYDTPPSEDYRGKDWEEYRRRYKAMMDACPVDVQLAGYDDALITCILIKETFVRAYWADVKPLKTLETKPEWDQQLREWCELLDVPYLQPGWFVASLYF